MISTVGLKSVADAAAYHEKAFSESAGRTADNYYLNEQASATWQGAGAALLGVEGKEVTKADFVNFLEGKLPVPGEDRVQNLRENSRGADRRPGQDFTIAPPKSVSVVALVGGDERVIRAHQEANQRAMEWLEDHAAVIRVKDGTGRPAAHVQAGNLLWATVTHETDRTNMPQLHNHNVIVSAVFDEQAGKWRSLTNDELFKVRIDADVVYKRELAALLREAGYDLKFGKNGVDFEIDGFSRKQVMAFSPRSLAIDEVLKARGIDPATASHEQRQMATLASRMPKQELPIEELRPRWQDVAQSVDLDIKGLVVRARSAAVGREERQDRKPIERDPGPTAAARSAVIWGVEHLSEREQAFKATDLVVAALKFNPQLRVDDVEAAVETFKRDSALLDRGGDSQGARLLTTPRARDVELTLGGNIAAGRGAGNRLVESTEEFDRLLRAYEERKSREIGERYRLSAEQVTAARNVLMHGDAIQGIQGEAGTGKTAALAFVREVAEAKRWQVVGLATSASAADELGRSSGIESHTLASFNAAKERTVRRVERELAELERSLQQTDRPAPARFQVVEHRRLEVTSEGVPATDGRYTFDHRRGAVFRATDGLVGTVGALLLEKAQELRERQALTQRRSDQGHAPRQQRMADLGLRLTERVGLRLSRLHEVTGAEAVAARVQLSALPGDDRLKRERQAGLKRAELWNLSMFGNSEGRRTLAVLDESSLTGARDLADLTTYTRSINARTVLQGDTKQHGSPAAGQAFAQAQAFGMHSSYLQETRRFNKATRQVKDALQEMKRGHFGVAYSLLPTTEVSEERLGQTVAQRYVAKEQELTANKADARSIGVVTLTNFDRKTANAEIHAARHGAGLIGTEEMTKTHLDRLKLTKAELHHATAIHASGATHLVFGQREQSLRVPQGTVAELVGVDVEKNVLIARTEEGRELRVKAGRHEGFHAARLEARTYSVGDRVEAREIIARTAEQGGRINNGTRGFVQAMAPTGLTVQWDDGRTSELSNKEVRNIDLSYARTSFKEQGATNQHEIVMVSDTGAKIFSRQAAYVASTRAKGETEVVTSNRDKMLAQADRSSEKVTALTPDEMRVLTEHSQATLRREHGQSKELGQRNERAQRAEELTRD